jgi:hypothetical protein
MRQSAHRRTKRRSNLLPGADVRDGSHETSTVHWHRPHSTASELPIEVDAQLSQDGQSAYTLQLRSVPVDLAAQILQLIRQRL